MTDLDPAGFDALTFDCYGTLIDWESGILAALRAQLDVDLDDEALLAAYGELEHAAQTPYQPYRDVLAQCLGELGTRFGIAVSDSQRAAFAASVGDWPAFPDSHDALVALQGRYRLAPITNCDDDLFALSAARLGITFDEVITAQQVGAYKPDERGFGVALQRLGLPRERVLHVAQSLFHDHVPAKRLGFTTVWINRRAGREGPGATPPAEAVPDVELPDLKSLAELLVG